MNHRDLQEHTRQTPAASLMWLELRALADVISLPKTLAKTYIRPADKPGRGRRVMVLPGFGADDRAMWPLRHYLNRHGFASQGWGLGRNYAGLDRPHRLEDVSWGLEYTGPYRGEAGVPHLCDLVTARVRTLLDNAPGPISLVGWSLGGTIAREVARELPDGVEQVVTLGSPIIGGPKYTRAADSLKRRGLNLDWIEEQVDRRNQQPMPCPVTAIVSRSDGIVDVSAAWCRHQEQTRYVFVDTPHLGMGLNEKVMQQVVAALSQPQGAS